MTIIKLNGFHKQTKDMKGEDGSVGKRKRINGRGAREHNGGKYARHIFTQNIFYTRMELSKI